MSDPRTTLLEALELNLQAQKKLHEALVALDKKEQQVSAEEAAEPGEIEGVRVGRKWEVLPSAIEAYRGLGQKGLA